MEGTPWLNHFIAMFRMLTGLTLVRSDVAPEEWRQHECTDAGSFWPDSEAKSTYYAYIHYGYGIETLVGALRIRDDAYFYGHVLDYGGNHDWSISELISSFKHGYERHFCKEKKAEADRKFQTRGFGWLTPLTARTEN
jgi:hypothetical protein